MRILKRIGVLCLLLMTMITVSACSEIRAMTMTNTDGTIDEVVYVSLDIEKVLSKGYNIEEMKLNIRTDSIAEANVFIEMLNHKINTDLMLTTDEETIEALNDMKNGISMIISEWQDDNFMIGIRFKNENIYKYFYNITNNSNIEPKVEKNFFYNKLTYYGNTMYIKHYALYERMNICYADLYPEFITDESVQLLYTYTSDLRRQHSNADYITYQDGKYYHTWSVDPNDIEKNVELYYNVANKSNCILFCIGLTMAIMIVVSGIVVIIHFIKNKYKKIN